VLRHIVLRMCVEAHCVEAHCAHSFENVWQRTFECVAEDL
jgi:hypothetical protein